MVTKIENQDLRVEEGRTKLIVTYKGEDLTFLRPYYGPDTYVNVENSIESDDLAKPTMAQNASLVHGAFTNPDNQYSKEIKDLMRTTWIWCFTGTLYVPNKGAYVQDHPEIRNGRPFMDESELVAKLGSRDEDGVVYSDDGTVRFVPFGFKIESMSPLELRSNPYVIALAGQEGTQKLEKVADTFRKNPYLWSFKSVDEPQTRVSALDSDWGFGVGLVVGGLDRGYDGNGCVFGVRRAKK